MLTSSIRNVLIALILPFTIGTSALVVTNFERDPVLHRRHAHAAAVANLVVARAPEPEPMPVPVSPVPRISLAKRREARQKRCIDRLQGSGPSSTSSSSTPVAPTDVPGNAAPAPIEHEQPTSSSQAQVEQPEPNPPSGNVGGGGSGQFTGELTFYDTGLGACGRTNNDGDMIAAASMLLFDGFEGYTGGNPNNNPICGRRVNIYFEGKSINVELVDRCVGCAKYE
ncbi:hypothetical protein FRC17_010511 [Serendipita sp. 399]|nr:hypothetical protein FRC17_010511 [Serendipita sp. 399]